MCGGRCKEGMEKCTKGQWSYCSKKCLTSTTTTTKTSTPSTTTTTTTTTKAPREILGREGPHSDAVSGEGFPKCRAPNRPCLPETCVESPGKGICSSTCVSPETPCNGSCPGLLVHITSQVYGICFARIANIFPINSGSLRNFKQMPTRRNIL